VVAQGTPLKAIEPTDRVQELQGYMSALAQGDPGINVLQKLALLCLENPVTESPSPPPSPGYGLPSSPSPFVMPSHSLPSLHADMWGKDKNFERLFNALIQFLEPSKVSCIDTFEDESNEFSLFQDGGGARIWLDHLMGDVGESKPLCRGTRSRHLLGPLAGAIL
jgi:hypothetical protein